MYLIDTSIWIAFFRQEQHGSVQNFKKILERNLPFGITGIIYQEILQGTSSPHEFKRLSEYLTTQRFYEPQDKIFSYQAAAHIYYQCKKKGLTIRSSIDCLIAQIAIENKLILLHQDKDYIKIAKIIPELQLMDLT